MSGYYPLKIANFTVAAFYQDFGSTATECVTGDWFGEVREVDLADLKQEPDDVCCVLCPVSVYFNKIICADHLQQVKISNYTVSQQTSHLWLAITLTHMNGF